MKELLSVEDRNRFLELEAVVDMHFEGFMAVGSALKEIKEKCLYRETHDNFNLYCKDRFGIGANYANRQIAEFETGKEVMPIGITTPKESHIRPLMKLPSIERRKSAIKKAVKNAGSPEELTAKHIEAAVRQLLGKPVRKKVSKKEFFTEIGHLVDTITESQTFGMKKDVLKELKRKIKKLNEMAKGLEPEEEEGKEDHEK